MLLSKWIPDELTQVAEIIMRQKRTQSLRTPGEAATLCVSLLEEIEKL